MDQQRREVIVHLLVWWLTVVQAMCKMFVTMLLSVALSSRRRISDRSYSRNFHGSEASSASRKRRRNNRDKEEMLLEVIREVTTNMDRTLVAVSESLGSHVDRLAHESTIDAKAEKLYLELPEVDGLTEDEINAAHIRIAESDKLMVGFPRIPAAAKASWIRRLIR